MHIYDLVLFSSFWDTIAQRRTKNPKSCIRTANVNLFVCLGYPQKSSRVPDFALVLFGMFKLYIPRKKVQTRGTQMHLLFRDESCSIHNERICVYNMLAYSVMMVYKLAKHARRSKVRIHNRNRYSIYTDNKNEHR